jgi:hypothetical protein
MMFFVKISRALSFERRPSVHILIFLLLIISLRSYTQTNKYSQIANEIQLARAISDKVSAELYVGGAFSDTPTEDKILKTNIQRYFNIWGNYYFSPRWKFSSAIAYYRNKDVPDIGQYQSNEWRLTLQGIYFFHKIGYTLSTRMRGELRYMQNEEGVYEDKYRYRQQVKFLKPLNSNFLRGGVFYFLTSEEIFLKPKAKTSGVNFFDRNRFEIGGGYLATDDIQLELTYTNEFLPRDETNEMYNCLVLTVTFNNLLPNLKKIIRPETTKENKAD